MHRPTEFAAALSGKRIARGAFFVVTAKIHVPVVVTTEAVCLASASPDSPAIARLGLIMAKRLAQHAATRNALKRVVREAFRAQRHDLPAADYVVRLNKKIQNMTLTEIKRIARLEVDAHFMKARRP